MTKMNATRVKPFIINPFMLRFQLKVTSGFNIPVSYKAVIHKIFEKEIMMLIGWL